MLFFKECKKIVFSLAFVIYCIVVLAFYFTQFRSDTRTPLTKPVSGAESYGDIAKEIPEILMPAAIESLVGEYLSDGYAAYPYGFYKSVRLKEKDKARMAEIIAEISGIPQDELDSFEDFQQGGYYMDENVYVVYQEPNIPEITIPTTMTYEHFRELMQEADQIIGGGSKYSDSFIVENFSLVPKTYEDALAEYEYFTSEDKITGAYARLFCDYLGIFLAIMPVFAAVALTGLDKRSRMEQLVYSRKISSAKLIFTRYFALISVMVIPVLLTTFEAYVAVKNIYPDNELDSTAFLRYTVFWLIPNIMTAAAVGMLITELASALLAIFVQGVWWFASVMAGSGGLDGNIGKFTFVMRHNDLLKADVFNAEWSNIVFNRIFFSAVSILAVTLTVLIYEMKRRGVFNGFQIGLPNFRHKSKA